MQKFPFMDIKGLTHVCNFNATYTFLTLDFSTHQDFVYYFYILLNVPNDINANQLKRKNLSAV